MSEYVVVAFGCVYSQACMQIIRASLCVRVFSLQGEERSEQFDKDESPGLVLFFMSAYQDMTSSLPFFRPEVQHSVPDRTQKHITSVPGKQRVSEKMEQG